MKRRMTPERRNAILALIIVGLFLGTALISMLY